jgi:hypothetical protein
MTRTPAAEGFYHNAIGIFKVVENQGSGRRYAKKLEVREGQPSWEYAPGAVMKLQANTRLSEATAARFGALYGVCICCMRLLDNEESIARGIGPVCFAKYFG